MGNKRVFLGYLGTGPCRSIEVGAIWTALTILWYVHTSAAGAAPFIFPIKTIPRLNKQSSPNASPLPPVCCLPTLIINKIILFHRKIQIPSNLTFSQSKIFAHLAGQISTPPTHHLPCENSRTLNMAVSASAKEAMSRGRIEKAKSKKEKKLAAQKRAAVARASKTKKSSAGTGAKATPKTKLW